MTRRHRITASVALALATGAATIALVAAFVAPASGTPPSGLTPDLLGRGTVPSGFRIRVDGVRMGSKGPVDFVAAHLTFAPGRYAYACSAHFQTMNGIFVVTPKG